MIATTAREARPRRLNSTLLCAAQILLAAFFLLGAALPKLIGSHSMVQEFALIGVGQWFRYLVGTLELAGAIGLLTPWLVGLAAAGLAADMAGATLINATVLHNTTYGVNVWLTSVLGAMFVLLAYGRRQQIKGLVATTRRTRAAAGSGAETEPAVPSSQALDTARPPHKRPRRLQTSVERADRRTGQSPRTGAVGRRTPTGREPNTPERRPC